MMSGPLANGSSQIAMPFQFPFIVLLHGRGDFFSSNPRRLYQLQFSSPTSSLVSLNFNPHCQLHPKSPTSTLIAFDFNPRRLSISKPRRFYISSPSP
jgi:hypothetical protein